MKMRIVATTIALSTSMLFATTFTFPQASNSNAYGLRPAGGNGALASDITTRFTWYKSTFLQSNTDGSQFIKARSTDGNHWSETVSEAHGYGMILMVIMDEQAVFNNMVKYYENYKRSNSLMNWKVYDSGDAKQGSATDGDLDIAYAFLLADKQWGGNNYKSKANTIISSIWNHEMYNADVAPLTSLGDSWYLGNSYGAGKHTRPSDWMPGHFRAFQGNGTGRWVDAVNAVYDFYMTKKHPTTGLVPDFFTHNSPAPDNSVEARNDSRYAMNACRVPLRFAMDYASGDAAARSQASAALAPINSWIAGNSSNNAANIKAGFELNGTLMKKENGQTVDYTAMEFTGPFGAGLIASDNQALMNSAWNELKKDYNYKTDNAYGCALSLLSMIVMSGNWWAPDAVPYNPGEFDTRGVYLDTFGDSDPQTDLEAGYGKEHYTKGDAPKGSYWGGYGWSLEDWHSGSVKAADGAVIENWQSAENTGNNGKMFTGGALKVTFTDSSAIATGFPNNDNDDATDNYFDLSDMTGFTVKAKGEGSIRFTFYTDKTGPLGADEWWAGFGVNIPLDGTMQEHQFRVDHLGTTPDSKEQTENWSWATNGAPKVRGVQIYHTGSGANAVEIESIKFNGVNMKCETFGFKTPKEVGNVTGENVIAVADWKKYESTGSTGTITENKTGDVVNSVKLGFNHSDAAGAWVSAVGGFFTEGTDFSALTAVEVIYSSNEVVKLKLPMADATGIDGADGWIAEHEVLLPNTNGVLDTAAIALASFVQPYGEVVPMDASLVKSVSLGLKDGASTGEITISSLKLAGANIVATPIVSFDGSAIAPAGISQVTSAAGMVRANLSLPQAGLMDLMIVNTQGRVIARENLSVNGGVNALSIDMGGNATGIYYMVANGAGMQLRQKFILQ